MHGAIENIIYNMEFLIRNEKVAYILMPISTNECIIQYLNLDVKKNYEW